MKSEEIPTPRDVRRSAELEEAIRAIVVEELTKTLPEAIRAEIQHQAEGEDDPKPQWIAEQLARLSRDVLSRG